MNTYKVEAWPGVAGYVIRITGPDFIGYASAIRRETVSGMALAKVILSTGRPLSEISLDIQVYTHEPPEDW
ncbi:hypothetical protein IU440_28710 [Nocardia cyriacigeorgica]|uniref:hypothetical protein n=1 Tax=Nocardia cyriacigeorgica TaxID=135487 RepID=UPI001895EA6E|nr:hypothetical protein [Nocardia cyriacigeorgica]MBF6428661.1 hypothetical protein [Nocardia cyriacigeorgica]